MYICAHADAIAGEYVNAAVKRLKPKDVLGRKDVLYA